MTIKCDNYDDLLDAIERLVHKGLGFDADYTAMTITLNGNY